MLPIGKVQVGRDWMELFTVLVWATVILIMFLSKLKAAQDVLIAVILGSIMAIMNADLLFARLRIYKIYLVLRKLLLKECLTAAALSFLCLLLHGMWPEAVIPGILLHIASLVAWISQGVQTSPIVSYGLWLGGQNLMTKTQLVLHVMAHCTGNVLAFAVWGLYYSFKFPGEGPFRHFFGVESACGAMVVFLCSIAQARVRDAKGMASKNK